MPVQLQSILIPRKNFTIKEAIKWISDNKFKLIKVHTTDNYYRFRQSNPVKNAKYRMDRIKHGIIFVYVID